MAYMCRYQLTINVLNFTVRVTFFLRPREIIITACIRQPIVASTHHLATCIHQTSSNLDTSVAEIMRLLI